MKETDTIVVPDSQIQELRRIQLKMLNKLLEVCNKYNLPIYADAGTLLGCIRHKGYIPWDDDIDMSMMRKDYEVLLKVSAKEFESPFYFQCFETEKGPYANGHAQIRMDDTTAILNRDLYISKDIHKGIFIDLFILDDIPNEKERRSEMIQHIRKEMTALRQRMCYSRLRFTKHYSKYRDYIRYYIGQKEFIERNMRLKEYIKSFASDENEYVCTINFGQEDEYVEKNAFRKEWYKGTIMMPFEDIMLPVPKGYHKILTQKFGDYMTPYNDGTVHGGYVILDTNKSYKEYGF